MLPGVKELGSNQAPFIMQSPDLEEKHVRFQNQLERQTLLTLQQPIRIDIPEDPPRELPREYGSSVHLDNSHMIEIETKGLSIRLNNSVHPDLLRVLLMVLR